MRMVPALKQGQRNSGPWGEGGGLSVISVAPTRLFPSFWVAMSTIWTTQPQVSRPFLVALGQESPGTEARPAAQGAGRGHRNSHPPLPSPLAGAQSFIAPPVADCGWQMCPPPF